MAKTPAEAIEEALQRLPTAQLFVDEKQAHQWLSATALGLLQHKLSAMELSAEEREQADPIEAVLIHAKDLGTKPRRQRIPWIDQLIESVANATFCEVKPLSGTQSTWLIGRHTDRRVAQYMLSSLVPTAEKLSDNAYYNEYHANRKAGHVERARGFKESWRDAYVKKVTDVLQQQVEAIAVNGTKEKLTEARNEVVAFMNENFLPTSGDRTIRLRK